MATIAKMAVLLTAGIGGFSSGMSKAGKQLASFGSSVTSIGAKVIGFGGALTALAAGGSLVYLTKQSMDAIDANAKLSDRLGMTTEGLVGLQYAGDLAGVSSEQLTGGLEKMLKALGGAADDGELASNAFTKLGLNAAELANLPADEAFTKIAQKIAGIENPAERASAAMAIFGKSGQSLLPLMTSGAEGIKAAQEEAAKLGLTYSRVDAAKVEQANDAITRMSKVFEGVTNQLAIGLAPYIEAASTKFVELSTTGGGIGPRVGGAVEWVAKAIATATDYLQLLPVGFYGFRAAALQSIAATIGALDWLGASLVKLINLIPGVNVAWTDSLSQLKQGLEQVAGEEAQKMNDALGKFQRGENAAAVAKVFDSIKAKSEAAAKATADNAQKMSGAFRNIEDNSKSLQKAADTLADLQKDVSQFGLSDSQKKIADLSALGAGPEQIARARELLAVKDLLTKLDKIDTGDPTTDFAAKMEQLQKLFAAQKISAEQFAAIRDTAKMTLADKLGEQAKSITESVKTPLEAYQAELDKLNVLLEKGLITRETFDRATLKAKATLAGAQDAQAAAPQIIRSASAEAQKFAFDQTRGVQRLTKDDLPKKQLAEQQDGNRILDRIEKNTRESGGTALEVVEI